MVAFFVSSKTNYLKSRNTARARSTTASRTQVAKIHAAYPSVLRLRLHVAGHVYIQTDRSQHYAVHAVLQYEYLKESSLKVGLGEKGAYLPGALFSFEAERRTG